MLTFLNNSAYKDGFDKSKSLVAFVLGLADFVPSEIPSLLPAAALGGGGGSVDGLVLVPVTEVGVLGPVPPPVLAADFSFLIVGSFGFLGAG